MDEHWMRQCVIGYIQLTGIGNAQDPQGQVDNKDLVARKSRRRVINSERLLVFSVFRYYTN